MILRGLMLTGFWWALKLVWPNRKVEIAWICLLLVVYPGFNQQSAALTSSRHFLCLSLYALSLGLNILAIRHPKHFWVATIPAVVLSMVELLTVDIFFGLEILRAAFIFFVVSEKQGSIRKTVWLSIKHFAPYFLVITLFVLFRFAITPLLDPDAETGSSFTPERLLAFLATGSNQSLNFYIREFLNINLFSWINTIIPGVIDFRAKATLFSWLISGVFSAGFVLLFIRGNLFREQVETKKDSFLWQAMFIGVLSFILGWAPVWLIGGENASSLGAGRSSLAAMPGAAVLAAALAEWFARRRLHKTIVLAVLFALAMSFQVQTVNKYRLSWEDQKDFYRQLSWRAPSIKPGTAIIASGMPLTLVEEAHIGFALNTIYAPDLQTMEAPYWFFLSSSLKGDLIPDFKPGYPINYHYQAVVFSGTTSNTLAAAYNSGADCLKILRPADSRYIDFSNEMDKQVKISNLEQIIVEPTTPAVLPAYFGEDPPQSWCYLYQKADLARQNGDWPEVVVLWQTARDHGFHPANLVEYIPFVEGLAFTGNWMDAYQVSKQAGMDSEGMAATYCKLWRDLISQTGESSQRDELHNDLQMELECAVNAPL
jgi:hypothetical protein